MKAPRAEDVLIEDVLDEGGADAAAVLAPSQDQHLRGWVIPAIIGSALLMQTLNATSINNALPAGSISVEDVVKEYPQFWLVEKKGEAGEIAEELAKRSGFATAR